VAGQRLNIVLDPVLIFGFGPIPAMGIEGAAIATNIGRGVGVLMQLWILFRGSEHLRIARASLRWHGPTLALITRTSLGGIGQMIVAMTAWIFLMRILASIGSEAVAGATIAMRIMMFTLMPAWGMSNAAATLVGPEPGRGRTRPGRSRRLAHRLDEHGVHAQRVGRLLPLARRHHRPLHRRRQVIAIGGEWLSILSYSYFVYGWWMVAVQAFNGAGDTMTPTWINLVFFWLIQIPLAWTLALPWAGRTRACSGASSCLKPRWACSPCGCSPGGAGSALQSEGGGHRAGLRQQTNLLVLHLPLGRHRRHRGHRAG
jgi:Na+-driven multidrug efflux pump